MAKQRLSRVANKYTLAKDTVAIELIAEEGCLPPFTAGAHIDIYLGNGQVRQYSLANDPSEQHRYLLGVLKTPDSRGVSRALHDQLQPNMLLRIGEPRNVFPLDESSPHTLLIGGGIGITPMLSMAWRLKTLGKSFELHLCSRSAEHAPFVQQLQESPLGEHFFLHLDDDPTSKFDPAARCAAVPIESHLYVCGPQGFMDWVLQEAAVRLPPAQLHYEHFDTPAETFLNPPFDICINSSGQQLHVPSEQSIMEVLAINGIYLPKNCPRGMCGACKIRVIEGEVDHRDHLLLPELKAEGWMLPCVSRAAGEKLLLDL